MTKSIFLLIFTFNITIVFSQTFNCDTYLKKSDSVLNISWNKIEEAKKYLDRYIICNQDDNSPQTIARLKNLQNYDAISLAKNKKGGWAKRKDNGRVGLIDIEFNFIKELPYISYYTFKDDYCWVKTDNGKFTVINYKGDDRLLGYPIDSISLNTNPTFIILTDEWRGNSNRFYGLINKTGEIVRPTYFINLTKYGNLYLANIDVNEHRWYHNLNFNTDETRWFGLINEKGEDVTGFIYDKLDAKGPEYGNWKNYVAQVYGSKGGYTLLDTMGKQLFPLINNIGMLTTLYTNTDTYAIIGKNKRDSLGLLNMKGEQVIAPKFASIEIVSYQLKNQSYNLILANPKNNYGYNSIGTGLYNSNGDIIINETEGWNFEKVETYSSLYKQNVVLVARRFKNSSTEYRYLYKSGKFK